MANPGLLSSWYNKDQLRELGEILQDGDLLEFDRGLYGHWAVCVEATGDIRVVHLGSGLSVGQYVPESRSSNAAGRSGITMAAMKDVLGNDKVRINNSKDEKFDRRPQKDVVKFAKEAVDIEALGEYDVLTNNCEHFASLCRYCKKKSEQVEDAYAAVPVVAQAAGMFGLGVQESAVEDGSECILKHEQHCAASV